MTPFGRQALVFERLAGAAADVAAQLRLLQGKEDEVAGTADQERIEALFDRVARAAGDVAELSDDPRAQHLQHPSPPSKTRAPLRVEDDGEREEAAEFSRA